VGEAVLISTCNRVEVYAAARAGATAAAAEVRSWLAQARRMDAERLSAHLYEHAGEQAVRHVFRVAASLDSLVIGEAQILGQLKSAYGAASQAGCVGPLLSRCLERAFGVAKRVRSETAIARGAANVSSVAVELARRIFGELAGKIVLLIGAGKMSDLAARHLRSDGAVEILCTNRSPERAEELARKVEGQARPFEDLDRLLTLADVVVTSTGSQEPILNRARMKKVVKARRHRPLFLIDIAVPRDIESACGELDGIYLFDIDDLQKVVAENLKERLKEADGAERIVEGETAQFMAWLRTQEVVPTIKDLRERFTQVVNAELERAVAALEPEVRLAAEKALRRMADAIVGKLLHDPLMALRHGDSAEVEQLVAATRRLFALEMEGKR
jgi:glutamyl-tRNA reductase